MDKLSRELFGKRNLDFVYAGNSQEKVKSAEQNLFGRTFSPRDYSDMVAALDNASIIVAYDEKRKEIIIETTHPFYEEEQTRIIGIVNGKKTIENVLFAVARPPAPVGIGARIAARQVERAQQLGFEQIILNAAGRPGADFNGYYVWPRLGYNMDISNMRSELDAAGFVGVQNTSELMLRSGGAEWWKNNGRSGDCVFDLYPSSSSHEVLNDYLKRKQINVTD